MFHVLLNCFMLFKLDSTEVCAFKECIFSLSLCLFAFFVM